MSSNIDNLTSIIIYIIYITAIIFFIERRHDRRRAGRSARLFLPLLILIAIFSLARNASGSTLLTVSPTSAGFGSVMLGDGSAKTVTLLNSGNSSISVTQATVTGPGFSIRGLALPLALPAGGRATFSASFVPATIGTFSGAISIVSTASNSPNVVSLSATGAANPSLTISPVSLTFPAQAIKTTSGVQTITLTNIRNVALTISNIAASGDFAQTNTCGTSVNASSSCSILVTFTPTSTGVRTGSIAITDNAMGSPQAVALSGTGAAPTASLSPTSLSFGNQSVGTTSAPHAVTLTNSGNSSLTITSVSFTGSNAYDFAQRNNCGNSIGASASCTLSVAFTPSAVGSRAASLSIADNASGSPHTVSVSGTGTGLAVSVSPNHANFGDVLLNSTDSLPVVLTNTGTGSVTISQATVTGTGFGMNSLSLPLTLQAGQHATFNVTFTPTVEGNASGNVSIVSNAANSPGMESLSGTGSTSVASTGCTGQPVPQMPITVTSTLGILPGAVVTQLTSGSAPMSSWNTYADVPLAATATDPNLLVTNYGTNPSGIAIANPDGTNAQKINGNMQGVWAVVSVDGQYVAYQGQNSDNTTDLYAINLTASGTCAPVNLSNLHLTLTPPMGALVYSTSQIDPNTGLNMFAFSEGATLRTVESDGTQLQAINFSDPYGLNGQVFHRFRLNPVFPNKIWFKRNAPNPNPSGIATPEIWVADLTNPSVVYNAAIVNGAGVPADHNSWSPDGTTIGFDYNGLWYTIKVLNSDGTWVNGGNFASATPVGPPSGSGLAVNYCSWAPDGSEYVCTQGPNSATNFTGEIYLMSLDGRTVTPLAYGGSAGTCDNGVPKPHFGDMQHIYFSSDLSGTSQVYSITGF